MLRDGTGVDGAGVGERAREYQGGWREEEGELSGLMSITACNGAHEHGEREDALV